MIDNDTGEVLEEVNENSKNYQLALKEFNMLPAVDRWIDLKEAYETAKEQFEIVDKPLRRILSDLFKKYGVHRLYNNYIDVILKNGYTKEEWDEEKLIAFIYRNGGDPKDFKKSRWVNGSFQIKYKG